MSGTPASDPELLLLMPVTLLLADDAPWASAESGESGFLLVRAELLDQQAHYPHALQSTVGAVVWAGTVELA